MDLQKRLLWVLGFRVLEFRGLGFGAYGDVKAKAIGQGLWAVVYYGYINFARVALQKGLGRLLA